MPISVIICTKNRPQKIAQCIQSICESKVLTTIEILVVDQSTNNETAQKVLNISDPRIRYVKISNTGVSAAKNYGIQHTSYNLIAFTDDDCIVDTDWLKTLSSDFIKHPEIVAVFGQTIPYKKTQKKYLRCPSYFKKTKMKIVCRPSLHSRNIGIGSNMAFHREIFASVGFFQEWLGVGAIGRSAEDGDFGIRLLLSGYKILYDPEVLVHHDRWISQQNQWKQNLDYIRGEVACYTFHSLKGHRFAKRIVYNNFYHSYGKIKSSIKQLLHMKKSGILGLLAASEELVTRLYGSLLGTYFYHNTIDASKNR